ncbi:MAG: hypothetical protein KF685_06955, partial [Acidobacteria bacterium]|nr:hypothetical protein [Acidobacteriota bacterium]
MKNALLLVIVIFSINPFVLGQSYAKVLKKSLAKANPNYSRFLWVTYPTTNNGVLSMGSSKGARYDPLTQRICPTFTCLGLSESLIEGPSGLTVSNLVTLD